MREAAFDPFSPLAQELFARFAANAPPILINRLLLFFFSSPLALSPRRLRTVTSYADLFKHDQNITAVITLVQYHRGRPFRIYRLLCFRTGLNGHLADLLAALRQCFADCIRVTRGCRVQCYRHHRAGLQIDRMLGLMREVRAAVLHLRDLRIGIMRIDPVLVGAFVGPLAIEFRQLLARGRLDSGFFRQLDQELFVRYASIAAYDRAQRRIRFQSRAIDGTTLEANAALRSIVRRDTGVPYEEFLIELAKESGIETPTREQLAKLDRKRPHKGSNQDWVNPHDPDAQITKMKDGRTHLAHKAEHAVDLETGAVVAVTLHPATAGDTNTICQTLTQCGEQIREVAVETGPEAEQPVNPEGPAAVVLDKGYHSSDVLVVLKEVGVRSYCSEPARGQRKWAGKEEEQQAVYQNRRRIRGESGKQLLRQRGERVERSFAHLYETGRMRRTHLRRHDNIIKRLLIHARAVCQ